MDYNQAVKDKKTEATDLQKRMDDDADLVNLAKFTLNDVNGHAIPNAISITLNDPAVFAANVESALGHASEQIAVETEDEKLDTAYIEDAVRIALSAANLRLTKQGRFQLNPFFDQSLCRRGRAAARCLFSFVGGELIPDITPWDPRYVYYDMGQDGLAWAAYETTRTKAQILAEYPGVVIKGKEGTVLDVWDTEHNEIWIDGKRVAEQEHGYGFTPVAIQTVPLGSMLVEKDGDKYEGESIFFLIRDLVPELNRLVSIIQSLNQKELDHALIMKKPGASTMKKSDVPRHADLTNPASVIAVEPDTSFDPVILGQLRQGAFLAHQTIETRIQRGSLSDFEYGTFSQPMSAVALITVGEGRDQVFLPRLGARGLLNQQLAFMLIDQILKSGESSVEIGTRGHKRKFETRKLEGEYDITFRYFVKSPKIDAARHSMAIEQRAARLIPTRAIRRDTLQRENPDEDERLLRWEEAEELSVEIKMTRTIKALAEMGERGDGDAQFEAELLSAKMGKTLEQVMSGELPAAEPSPQPKQVKSTLPIFEETGKTAAKRGTAQMAADITEIPQGAEP